MKLRGFSLAEMLATVTIIAILGTMMVAFFPSYSSFVSTTVASGNVETLNKALEMYKVQGGIYFAHSLAGPNTANDTGKAAIINALKNGFTLGGSPTQKTTTASGTKVKFLESSFNLSPSSLYTVGTGKTLYFTDTLTVTPGYSYFKLTIIKRYTGTANAIQISELKLKNGAADIAWPSGTTATGIHPFYSPGSASEVTAKLIDGLTTTKYCDIGFDGTVALNSTSVRTGLAVILFTIGGGQKLVPTAFAMANANDTSSMPPRVPISWTFEGSSDNVNWTTLHSVSDWTPTTFVNYAWLGPFTFL